jgi:hypothetical protein
VYLGAVILTFLEIYLIHAFFDRGQNPEQKNTTLIFLQPFADSYFLVNKLQKVPCKGKNFLPDHRLIMVLKDKIMWGF